MRARTILGQATGLPGPANADGFPGALEQGRQDTTHRSTYITHRGFYRVVTAHRSTYITPRQVLTLQISQREVERRRL